MAAYKGMSRTTGTSLVDLDHLRQSVGDILTTPIGSRIERREYGSDVPDLIDAPYNDTTRLQLMSAIVSALARWEPRVQVLKLEIVPQDDPGKFSLDLDLVVDADGIPSDTGLTVRLN